MDRVILDLDLEQARVVVAACLDLANTGPGTKQRIALDIRNAILAEVPML